MDGWSVQRHVPFFSPMIVLLRSSQMSLDERSVVDETEQRAVENDVNGLPFSVTRSKKIVSTFL